MDDRRDRVYRILSGAIAASEEEPQQSAFSSLQSWQAPVVRPDMTAFVLIPISLIAAAVLLFFFEAVRGPIFAPGISSMLILLLVVIWLWSSISRHKRKVSGVSEHYHQALLDLKGLHDYLDAYLSGLDERTSRYFHCVTSSKVLNYCVLRQLNAALGERVQQITALLARREGPALLKAHELLTGMLFFYDGALANTGNAHLLPMQRLHGTLHLLVENLESGVAELEDEITEARSRYDNPEDL